MSKKIFSLLLILFMIVPLIAGCSGGDDDSGGIGSGSASMEEIGKIESLEHLQNLDLVSMSVSSHVIDSSDGVNDEEDAENLQTIKDYVIDRLKAYFGSYIPVFYKVTYNSTDAAGNPQKLTGLMVIPASVSGKASVPILSMQHPTQVERKYSPSKRSIKDNEFTCVVAGIISMTGYVVVVADYPGLGDNYDVHPYCHKSLSHSVVDLIRVASESKDEMEQLNVEWNGKLVLMGYSEGGYATMVSAQKLQEDGIFEVGAVAPLDGPYSLSVTMKNVMLTADASYGAPYFLPYFIAGYESVYTPNITFSGAIKESVPDYTPPAGQTFATVLYSLLDGSHTSAEISDFMRKATPYEGPRSAMKDDFIDQLKDDTSYVCTKLEANNGYEGWTPNVQMKMFHNKKDDYVPYDNMLEAEKVFPQVANIQYDGYTEYIPISDSIHADSFPVAMVMGFLYVDKYAYPDRH